MIGGEISSIHTAEPSEVTCSVYQPMADGRYAGLVPLHVRTSPAVKDLHLAIDGEPHGSLAPRFALSETEFVWQGAVNSLYLQNGRHTFTYQLFGASGEPLGTSSVHIETMNFGELSDLVRQALDRSGRGKLVLPGFVDSQLFPVRSEPLTPWFDREDALSNVAPMLARYGLPPDFAAYFESFIVDGYFEIPQLIDREWCDTINTDLERLIASGDIPYQPGSGNRIDHMFLKSEHTRMLWRHPMLMRILRALFDDEPTACQTLNFIHGSQQAAHQDVISLSTYPVGYMCGVWVALEDIHPDSGPLEFYPGSHKAAAVFGADVGVARTVPWYDDGLRREIGEKVGAKMKAIAASSSPPLHYTPKAGSALVWHSNLLHGGSPRKNRELTRKSVVSHYYARGALAFTDATGITALRTLMEILLAW